MTEPLDGDEATSLRKGLLVGTVVNGYELETRIGFGGMGEVYSAWEPNIGRRAAVKVLLPDFAENPELVERFKAEARAANAAKHRGIIDVFGFATLPDGRHAIVMELLEGQPLHELISQHLDQGQLLPIRESLRIVADIASALQAAHDAGVVHRDLKPSNIFLCADGDQPPLVKVLDFGIAKLDRGGPKTRTNMVLGTPLYMSPEQARGKPATPSMDLYSLGVIAFELLTSRVPFRPVTVMELFDAHQREVPPRPSTFNPLVSPEIDAFVLKMLEKDPAQRPPNAKAIRDQARLLLGSTSQAQTRPVAAQTDLQPLTASVPQMPAVNETRPETPSAREQATRPSAPRAQRGAQTVASRPARSEPPRPVERPPEPDPGPSTLQLETLIKPSRTRVWILAGLALCGVAAGAAWLSSREPEQAPPREPVSQPAPTPTPTDTVPDAAVAVATAEPTQPEPVAVVDAGPPTEAVVTVETPDAGVAEPRVAVKSQRRKPAAPVDRAAALLGRLDVLQRRFTAGSGLELELAQVRGLKERLSQDRKERTLDAVESATRRLEAIK